MLNELPGTPHVDDYTFRIMTLIIHDIYYPGIAWKVPGTYTCFGEKFLKLDPSVWYAFLTKWMMPVSHTSEVQKKWVTVMYDLV